MLKISVIIPTHNREKMCKRAIASVLSQTYSNYEIIVSNDSEEDYNVENSYIFNHPKVRYFKKNPEGYDKNYMFLAEKATGDYIYCLEDDDYLINHKVFEKSIELIKKYKDVNAVLIKSSLSYKEAVSNKNDFKEIYTNTEFFKIFPQISTDFQLGQVLARTSLMKNLILEEVPKHSGSVNTDAFLFLLLCLVQGNICHTNSAGYLITVNGDNLSWDNYTNCFFGGNSYIQSISRRALDLDLEVNLKEWQEEMEYQHISHLLEYLPRYLEGADSVEHS